MRARVKRVRPRMRGWVFVVRRMELRVLDIVARLARADAACGVFGCVLLAGWID